ncbi:MAG: C4-type zinc ribbon domain-containing protein [Acidobacteriota bacterium]|nr:C4-type zinc ribbon domain-containing protein [Acidobacteriota bacterium]
MLPDLERLIQLQEIESRAAVAAKAIAEAPGRIASLDALLKAATAALESAKHALAENKTRRGLIDKDLAAAQQRQDKYKDQVMAVKTNEQLHAMQHQIKAVADEIGLHEEKVLVNMMEADEINAAIKAAEAALKASQAKVGTERGAIEADVTVQQAVVTECAAARTALVASLSDKGLVDTFARIAKVRGSAVARAEGERCTVCQVRLRPAVFVNVLKNDQIVQCDSCNRILYFIPPVAAPAPPAAPDPPAS